MAFEINQLAIGAVKKLMGAGFSSILRRRFDSSKCKAEARMAMSRIKLLQNKREAQVRQMRQMRRDVALLLESGRDETARIRVEHVIREQNVMAANDIIELFCELIVARLPIIAKQRDCPQDLKEGISSLIYASPRCSDIPELSRILLIFEKKYGKDFVSAATELRPKSEVNCLLIEKLSVRKPIGEVKLKVLKEIAKEYQVKWDSTELEQELLVPPERVIEGPRAFADVKNVSVKPIFLKQPKDFNRKELQFKDPVSAAQASSESAEKAIDGEQAASHVANQNSHPFDQPTPVDTLVCKCNKFNQVAFQKEQELDHLSGTHAPSNYEAKTLEKRPFSSQSFSLSNTLDDDSIDSADLNEKKILRRNSCISRTVYSDIKFDDSDGHESENGEQESDPSPNRPPPVLPSQQMNSLTHVHPNLSDYAALTARFEALKSHRM
ncbi:IST1-like protein isoform X1 [Zingiber officinale]|uniref:IST1-like protein isoform X1 n=1 Tax=Zingiber officinale TaxID=94328 RepID=UPI001C4B1CEA|nr:IST1-like protein isoform X1 [Zingiber officinale]